MNTPLPALRLYLEGQAAQRRAEYADAVARFGQALDVDSTFALAGMALASAAGWTNAPGAGRRGLERAWASRDRLSERDKALVFAEVGPAYPATSTVVQHLDAWERAVDLAPDQPDRWYELGDVYFHDGPFLRIEATRRRAAEAFRRSVALDSNTAALGHLLEVAVLDGDTAGVRHLGSPLSGPRHQRRRAAGTLPLAHRRGAGRRQRAGRHAGGVPADAAAEPVADHEPPGARRWQVGGADSAAAAIRAVAGRSSDWQRSKTYLHAFEVNRGRPAKALADTAGSDETEYGPHAALYQRVLDALYGDGDSVSAGASAMRELGRRRERRALVSTDRSLRGDTLAAQPRRGRRRSPGHLAAPTSRARRLATVGRDQRHLRHAAGGETPWRARGRRWIGWTRSSGAGPEDSATGPPVAFTLSPAYVRSTIGISPCGFEDFVNLEVARLRERQGDLRAALAAVRRRPYAYHLTDYLAAHLRAEGRLAALTGDSAGAVGAYRHYLALRSDVEPSVRPSVDSVRAELAKLVGTP